MTEIILGAIIIALVVERFIFAREMYKQIDSCMKALISKNSADYVAMKSADKTTPVVEKETDEIPLDQADDATFTKFIKSHSE